MRLECKYEVQAAHRLTAGVPEGHPCRRLHGHRYNITVTIEGVVDSETGMILEYEEIDARIWKVLRWVDHFYLNELGMTEAPSCDSNPLMLMKIGDETVPAPELAKLVRRNSTVEHLALWMKAAIRDYFASAYPTRPPSTEPTLHSIRIEEDSGHTVEL